MEDKNTSYKTEFRLLLILILIVFLLTLMTCQVTKTLNINYTKTNKSCTEEENQKDAVRDEEKEHHTKSYHAAESDYNNGLHKQN